MSLNLSPNCIADDSVVGVRVGLREKDMNAIYIDVCISSQI
ncbi:hypothetical protein QUF72_16300 [Desulfobacterales bacterium HSG2]|nr:hypothetical protein [Desulfobacterales bacterium HSG2]